MYADLHVHSCFSDGTDTPAELFALASKNGLSVMAISDHDTVDGVREALKADNRGMRLIPAIEVSTVYNRRFLHMLGYYVDIDNAELARFIIEVSADKTENTRINFEHAMADNAFTYSWERVKELNRGQIRLSGVHVVKAMKQDGYECNGMTHREMFWRYFRPEGAGFIETEKSTAQDAINIIRTAGGIPVIAHPKLVEDDGVVLEMIRCGAQGIEVHYPQHTEEETRRYLQMAKENRLLITGGSDWHGGNSAPSTPRIGATGLEHGGYDILNINK